MGHGIGRTFHCPPGIIHCHNRTRGVMEPGHVFTVEPNVNEHWSSSKMLSDGWTAVTVDGGRSAQCEHTVVVTSTVCSTPHPPSPLLLLLSSLPIRCAYLVLTVGPHPILVRPGVATGCRDPHAAIGQRVVHAWTSINHCLGMRDKGIQGRERPAPMQVLRGHCYCNGWCSWFSDNGDASDRPTQGRHHTSNNNNSNNDSAATSQQRQVARSNLFGLEGQAQVILAAMGLPSRAN